MGPSNTMGYQVKFAACAQARPSRRIGTHKAIFTFWLFNDKLENEERNGSSSLGQILNIDEHRMGIW